MATTSSSSPFIGSRPDENQTQAMMQPSSIGQAPMPPPPKKKRNQPGTSYPNAEVIALSPRTLTATNRFICEVCNKGFQREQNLQLHRRGHNLPWKLKQKSNKEVRRKVYLCPVPTCVHHDASRALGDLTGIKKHFFRKHGEKKWKCDKCAKTYAVLSDWKAHSKTCGTKEYRCDCGALFSRRDSFITHRAFCDALARESAGQPSQQDYDDHHSSTNMLRLGSANFMSPTSFGQSSGLFMQDPNQGFESFMNKPLHGLMQLPHDLQPTNNFFINPSVDNSLFSGEMLDSTMGSFYNTSPPMSATALLQQASQMGSTTSTDHSFSEKHLTMNPFAMFGQDHGFGGTNNNASFIIDDMKSNQKQKLTLDFLGVGGMSNMSGNNPDTILPFGTSKLQ